MENACWSGRDRALLVFAAITAFTVRLIPWPRVIEKGKPLFFQHDAYYHLRRAQIYLNSFPDIPAIDRYMAYPSGAECPWPPLYDAVIAMLSAAFGRFPGGSEEMIPWVTTLLPPVLAALTVFLVALTSRRLAGCKAAILSAFFLSVAPGHLEYSLIGSGDHHTAEALLLAAFLLFHLASLQAEGGRAGRNAVAAGVALGASTLIWLGSVTFAAYAVSGTMLFSMATAPGTAPEHRGTQAVRYNLAKTCLTAAALVATARLLYPSGASTNRFGFGFFSWFQPLFFSLMAAGLALSARLERMAHCTTRFRGKWLRVINATFIVLSPMLLFAFLPDFRMEIGGGIRFLLTQSAWLRSISEFQPYLSWEVIREIVATGNIVDLAYLAIFFGPVVLSLIILSRGIRRGILQPGETLFVAWTLAACALTIGQRRWANAYAINIAVGWGWICTAAGDKISATPRITSHLVPARRWAPLAIFVPALAATLSVSRYALEHPPNPLPPHFRSALSWIRTNTPPTDGWRDGRIQPAYAVMSLWDYGHAIQHEGRRATIANNFVFQLHGGGMEEMIRFFLAPDEEAMESACAERSVRYVLATDVFQAEGFLQMVRPFAAEFPFPASKHGPDQAKPEWEEAIPFLPYSRLLNLDGTESTLGPALRAFRLVHEAYPWDFGPGTRDAFSVVKIFERVPGAQIRGTLAPGKTVALSCRLVTDAGRAFTYRSTVVADASGNFNARFPYATTGRNGGITASGRVTAVVGNRVVPFDVTEEEVLSGLPVEIR